MKQWVSNSQEKNFIEIKFPGPIFQDPTSTKPTPKQRHFTGKGVPTSKSLSNPNHNPQHRPSSRNPSRSLLIQSQQKSTSRTLSTRLRKNFKGRGRSLFVKCLGLAVVFDQG